jgi:hypothetical protein
MKNIEALEKRLWSRNFTKRLNWRGNVWRQNLRSAGDIINFRFNVLCTIQNTNYINWIKSDIEGINLEL